MSYGSLSAESTQSTQLLVAALAPHPFGQTSGIDLGSASKALGVNTKVWKVPHPPSSRIIQRAQENGESLGVQQRRVSCGTGGRRSSRKVKNLLE